MFVPCLNFAAPSGSNNAAGSENTVAANVFQARQARGATCYFLSLSSMILATSFNTIGFSSERVGFLFRVYESRYVA